MFSLLGGAIQPGDYPAMLLAECARLNRAGLTTCSEMAFDPMFRPVLEQLRDQLTVRLRTYEMSTARMTTDADASTTATTCVRQVGIKIWVDGSPWIGNIDLSFPYLDTDATRTIGVAPGSCGHANYTREQLTEIVDAYFPLGWQMACHVRATPASTPSSTSTRRRCRSIRAPITGCGSSTSARSGPSSCSARTISASRAASSSTRSTTGATSSSTGCSGRSTGIALDAVPVPPSRPACGSRCTTIRRSRPEEPLRNISVAATRIAPSGRVLAPEERLTVEQAIRAQTIDAAWQLFADDVIGSLEVGKYADMVVLSADPRTVPPEEIADLEVRATYLAGRQVYGG